MSERTDDARSGRVADRRIRALRPPKPALDAQSAHGWLLEDERRPDGTAERALTVFLTGAECVFTCSFCDLWRWTLDVATPEGALPAQLTAVLQAVEVEVPRPDRLKLYNASNFFHRRAVPVGDLPRLAELAAPFAGVTVESHAATIGPAALEFARRLAPGARLEVAVGLETIHPVAAAQLNKKLDLATFDRGARYLADNGMDLRVFVLLGAPYVPAAESVEWAVRTVEYAAQRGAAVVSIIPLRGGNGEMERLAALGHVALPTLRQLEEALDRCLGLVGPHTVVTADTWDIERLAACRHCRGARAERLRRTNASARRQPPVACAACGSGETS